MTCELFGTFHILTLVSAIALPILLYLILRKSSDKTKRIVLGFFSFINVSLLIYEIFREGTILNDLPLHMCSITGLLVPVLLLTKNKRLGNMLILWCVGAFGALIFSFETEKMTTENPAVWVYYLTHLFQFALPVAIMALKIVELDYKTIPSTLLLTVLIYTIVHLINLTLTEIFIVYFNKKVWINYMFSMFYDPNNVFLNFLWNLLPYRYFYMYTILPAVLLFLLIIYHRQLIRAIKERKIKKEESKLNIDYL